MKGVNVEIMGQHLTVASDADDEWVKTVAKTVDERIKRIGADTRAANSINLAILAALNFADELERLKREHQQFIDRIEAMNRRLRDVIDSHDPQRRLMAE